MAQTKTQVQMEIKTQKRRQVGILGGNFNPVHQAHLAIADLVKQHLSLDLVYLMPEFLPPHIDTKTTIEPIHRLNMLERAVIGNPNLGIETIELSRGGKSYTYETILELKELNPDTDYYFIIGSDMVEYLPKWYKIDELTHLVQFVGVKRGEKEIQTPYPVIWVDVPKMDISSTMIRQMFKENILPNYLLPQKVIEYIQEQKLYK
ncbi:MAG: nicotinate-nucleotide adenylyltransferase [Streptococcaceae bacterium]|jgi:nicotinate-nucleotide adenylyltransferase|nr:nicotinate-nucleotide adenylyltransferase [Streptococcaceae bacterium]